MWEIFLSVDSHDSADRLTVGISHLFNQMSHTFLHIFNFLPLTTLLMSPFCFCLLLGFCHKWNEGRGASLVKSLARSYNVHSSCIQEKWEWKHVLNQADGWLAASFVTTLFMFVSNNGPGMFCPIVFSLFRWVHVKSVPQVLSGAITSNGLKWKEWGNLSTTIFSRICLDGGWW